MKEDILRILQNSDNFKEFEEKIYDLVCGKTVEIIEEVFELVDKELMENRDKSRLKNKDKKGRTLKTKIGCLELNRRYYKDTEEDEYCFLLDQYFNIPSNERQSPALKESALKLIQDATYRVSSDMIEELLGVSVSHQAIHNWVQDVGEKISKQKEKERKELFEDGVVPDNDSDREEIDHIFVEADGVYINLQQEEKSSGELKLGMSYQGWERKHPSSEEYRVIDKKFYGGVFESTKFWEQTASNLHKYFRFNEDAVTVLNGDGAGWIATGEEYIPYSPYRVLDSFHWNRKILRKLGRSSFVPKVQEAIKEHDKDRLIEVLEKAKSYRKKQKDKKKVEELKEYLLNNWEALKDYREEDLDLPKNIRGMGAIESNIDKILANRFKKRGMRWSKDGARNLAKIILADRNDELEGALSRLNWEFKDDEIEKEYRTVKDIISQNKYQIKRGKLPALEGPDAGKSWVKGLRDIAS